MSHNKFPTVAKLAILAILAILPLAPVKSQNMGTLQPGFGQTIIVVHKAESAGATSREISVLVGSLNKALEQDREALKLNAPNEAEQRTKLLAQVDQTLRTVQNQAIDLTAVAYQRTFMNEVLTYVSGAIAAVLGTITYVMAVSFHQKYRIKRTFQMKVSRK